MRFAREAWPFAAPPAAASLLLLALGRPLAAAGAALLAVALLAFFRIPRRPAAADDDAVLAPANGRVLAVERVEEPELGAGPWLRIAVFLSVFDVHVQRAPVAGRVEHSTHRTGRKVAAFRADADRVNESHLTVIRRPDGGRVGVRQIAGLVARRVVCYLSEGTEVARGDLLGLIKFGSRVDLLLPPDYDSPLERGDRVVEGSTVAARAAPPERAVE